MLTVGAKRRLEGGSHSLGCHDVRLQNNANVSISITVTPRLDILHGHGSLWMGTNKVGMH